MMGFETENAAVCLHYSSIPPFQNNLFLLLLLPRKAQNYLSRMALR